MKKKWVEEGVTLTPMSGPDFTALIARDTKRWSDLISTRRIREES